MRSVVLATPVGGIPDLIKWGGQRCPPFFLSPLPLQPQMVTGGVYKGLHKKGTIERE